MYPAWLPFPGGFLDFPRDLPEELDDDTKVGDSGAMGRT